MSAEFELVVFVLGWCAAVVAAYLLALWIIRNAESSAPDHQSPGKHERPERPTPADR